jgi:hypothetical protein
VVEHLPSKHKTPELPKTKACGGRLSVLHHMLRVAILYDELLVILTLFCTTSL